MENKTTQANKKRVGTILHRFYLSFVIFIFIAFARVIYIQFFFSPNERDIKYFSLQSKKIKIDPIRGSIYDCNGKLLAMSTPMYQIYMDCTIGKEAFQNNKKEGAAKEQKWRKEVEEMSAAFAKVYRNKSAREYYNEIISGRANKERYHKIGYAIEQQDIDSLAKVPFFSKRRNYTGIIINTIERREYPYGDLAVRTIGYVKDNSKSNGNDKIGLEGKFDDFLHGEDGYMWVRKTDGGRFIQDFEREHVPAINGASIHSTININYQDIANKSLQDVIKSADDSQEIERACLILMETKTGAIRALVNLQQNKKQELNENYNIAIAHSSEMGSVFKPVMLTALMEDGFVKSIDQTIPTNGGIVDLKKYKKDEHIPPYEKKLNLHEISVREGLRFSSNYVFQYLIDKSYDSKPQKITNRLKKFRIGESFDFDLQGLASPSISKIQTAKTTGVYVGMYAIGYGIQTTPLHLLTFYNTLANRGKMMKPYLVEYIERNGDILENRGPSVLEERMCSEETALAVTEALCGVTSKTPEGNPNGSTAARLANAKLKVAGKTGTAMIALNANERAHPKDAYKGPGNSRKYTVTFVGFFPAENPKYSIICTMTTKLVRKQYSGGRYPALAIKAIVDKLANLDEKWFPKVEAKGSMPKMTLNPKEKISKGIVPELRGLGIKDAIYILENSGYQCNYSGVGQVIKQSIPGGSKAPLGSTITLTLK